MNIYMELWFIISVISAIISSWWSLSVKGGLQVFAAESYAAWYSVVSAILVGVYVYIKTNTLNITKWGVASGISAGVASLLLAKSFELSPNPGYSMAVFSMQSVLTAVSSYFLHNATISIPKVIGMLVAIFGVITLSIAKSDGARAGVSKVSAIKKNSDKKNSHSKKENYEWVLLAFIAGAAMTCKDLFTKSGLNNKSSESLYTLLWGTSLMQGISLLIFLFIKNNTISIKTKKPSVEINSNLWHVVTTGTAFALYQFYIISAVKIAPNAGYVKAIVSLGTAITAVASHYLYGSKIDTQGIIGIVLILCGVAGMSQ